MRYAVGNMTRTLISAVIALVVVLAAPAWGQDVNDDELVLVHELSVVVQDEVKNGCLTQPEVLKATAEQAFRSAGIRVVDPTASATHRVNILAMGGEVVAGSCVVRFDLQLWRGAQVPEGHHVIAEAALYRRLLGADKQTMRARLADAVREDVTDLTTAITKARANNKKESQESPPKDE
jgi:hypothetical protein